MHLVDHVYGRRRMDAQRVYNGAYRANNRQEMRIIAFCGKIHGNTAKIATFENDLWTLNIKWHLLAFLSINSYRVYRNFYSFCANNP